MILPTRGARVKHAIAEMAKSYGMAVDQFKKSYNNPEDMKRLKDDLLYPAVMDFLYKNSRTLVSDKSVNYLENKFIKSPHYTHIKNKCVRSRNDELFRCNSRIIRFFFSNFL